MERKVYNSAIPTKYIEITALYYNAIDPTTVWFEQEKFSVYVDSLGHIEFFDEADVSLGSVDFPVSDDPAKYAHTAQYGTVRCSADGKKITVSLPIYWWSDSYPNCDGESDRWTRHTERWFDIVFDCKQKTISVLNQ